MSSAQTKEEAYRTAVANRSALVERLHAEGAITLANKLAKCGEEVPLNCIGCGERRIGRSRCDQRWCPVCQRALATRTSLRYAKIAEDCEWPLVCTFSAQHSIGSFMTPKQLSNAFRKIRRLRWWKARVPGGVASFEITNKFGNGWHVHIHALMDCQWLAVDEPAPKRTAPKAQWKAKGKRAAAEVSEQWSLCCSRPGSVHIRRGRGGRAKIDEICREALKYAVKGSELLEMKGPIAPVIRAMAGCRLVVSWGSFYRHPAAKREKPAPAMCKCGCSDWMLEKQVDAIVARTNPNRGTRKMVHFEKPTR